MNEHAAIETRSLARRAAATVDRITRLVGAATFYRAAGNQDLAARCEAMADDEYGRLHALAKGVALVEAVRRLAVAAPAVACLVCGAHPAVDGGTRCAPCTAKPGVRCPYCQGETAGPLASCPRPECIPRGIADAVQLERRIEASEG